MPHSYRLIMKRSPAKRSCIETLESARLTTYQANHTFSAEMECDGKQLYTYTFCQRDSEYGLGYWPRCFAGQVPITFSSS